MTKREREQVVECLRCGADMWSAKVIDGVAEAFALHGPKIHWLATNAWCGAGALGGPLLSLLETAALVEEGSYP